MASPLVSTDAWPRSTTVSSLMSKSFIVLLLHCICDSISRNTEDERVYSDYPFYNHFIIGPMNIRIEGTGYWKHMLGCTPIPLAFAWTCAPVPGQGTQQ